MVQQTLVQKIREAATAASFELGLDGAEIPEPDLTKPKLKEHGDWATNIALVLASRTGASPRKVAEAIAARVDSTGLIRKIEVAGPGFINLFLDRRWLHDVLGQILDQGPAYGRTESKGRRVQVEYVSANPTGPLHVGTARNAAIGDSLANVVDAAGYDAEREYYWNDTGTQMDLFAASVEARYLAQFGVDAPTPEGGYHGVYLDDLAQRLKERFGDTLVREEPTKRREVLLEEARRSMLDSILATLARFGVRFDTFRLERELVESGEVAEAVDRLTQAGYAYEADGAIWFAATRFGDDKDRVLIRRTGEPTYFAKDCAYVLDKARRGFDRMIYVWGADHHGDVKRLLGAAQALGVDPSRVEIILYQLVSLFRVGEPVRMSKRTGEIITLDELLDEVGPDAARFTLLTRSPDSPIDFDIEAVTRQSLDNPVYYVQYAHARIASVIRVAEERGVRLRPWREADFGMIQEEAELDLLRTLSDLPSLVELAAHTPAPHRLTRYAEEVAAAFHHFYAECRVIGDDDAQTQSRLWLCVATKQVIATVLSLIGVSAPESMERLDSGGA